MYDIKVLTYDIIISQYCNTISYPISNQNFDIVYISSVQRASKLNIVPDIEDFFSTSMQYRVHNLQHKERLFGESSISCPISYTILMPIYNFSSKAGASVPRPPSIDSNEDREMYFDDQRV